MLSSALAQRGTPIIHLELPMFKETVLSRSVRLMFSAGAIGATLLAQPALAQQADDAAMQKVVVTGSAIKRLDGETSVPITVLKMSDLKKEGITTVEQVMSNISASQSTQGTSQSVGLSTGGASFADLRGIGANKTLVLLNGRRLANNAIDSSAPDLNMIPFAAIDRVEVLRDGASSLYGSDAVGGVINFITRKDFTGGIATVGFDTPKGGGGLTENANVGFGYGNIDTDGFNLFGVLDFQKQNSVNGGERSYNTRFPGGLSSSTTPANYIQNGVTYNPLALSGAGCASAPLLVSNGGTGCQITTSPYVDYVPKSERDTGLFKGTFKLPQGHELGLEYLISRSVVATTIAPVPYGALAMNSTLPDGTANPYYPTTATPGTLTAKWRDTPNGPRTDENVNRQQRLVASLQGNVAGWDYQTALTYNENKVALNLTGGYTNGDIINAGVLNGIINPFGEQSAAGSALLASAGLNGTLQTAKGTTKGFDINASREFGDWFGAGRNTALAIGGQAQHESFTSSANTEYAEKVIASTGVDPYTLSAGSRNVYAVFGELNVPITKELDVTAAVRYDKYSDFGNTTNPKFSFRYQPTKQVLVRGSYSTGFRAPSLYEINAANTYTNTSQQNDPVLCTATATSTCKQQFQAMYGGNKNLTPEKSKNATFGLLVAPIDNLTLGADLWFIKLENQIGQLAENDVFNNATKYASLYHRNAAGELATDGSQCPNPTTCGYVDLRTQNLGDLITNGVDLSATYRYRTPAYGIFNFGMNSTWVHKYSYQNEAGGAWNSSLGTFTGTAPVFRWQNTASVNWNLNQWSAGLTGHYKTGYSEPGYEGDGTHAVPSYITLDTFAGWAQPKGYALTFGIRNLADRAPPLSYQTTTFQAGYDPRFTDVMGRTYYVRASYSF
jgi:iron complex outermembrane receptor protein